MKNRWRRNLTVEMLAYAYRYVYLIAIGSMPIWVEKEWLLLAMGIGAIIYAAYGLVGYLCRWKHIYCAFQSTRHESMTPNDIRWYRMGKKEAYLLPVIFGCLGSGMLITHFVVAG